MRVYNGKHIVYTGSIKDAIGIIMCSIGFHNRRARKNGNKIEYVCMRPCCEYTERKK